MKNGRVWIIFSILLLATVGLIVLLDSLYPGMLRGEEAQMNIVYKLALVVFLLCSVAVSLATQRISYVARSVAVWLALGFILVLGYSYKDELAPVGRRLLGSLSPMEPTVVEPGIVALRTGTGGHFRAVAEINGERVTCLVDTGASDVALPQIDAKRAGVDVAALNYAIPYSTANGTVLSARVRLDRVKVGDITLQDVAASVAQDNRLEQCLLGMSFLSRLDGFEIRGGELILRR